MYTIINVVYGTPFDDASETDLEAIQYLDGKGLNSYYSGSLDCKPSIFGVKLDEFDECHDGALDVSTLKLVPTQEQMEEYDRLVTTVHSPIKINGKIIDLGDPKVYFVFSNS